MGPKLCRTGVGPSIHQIPQRTGWTNLRRRTSRVWSNDIDLFMEGPTNPDKIETLWEQSKAKILWDDSQNRVSIQPNWYLSESHLAEDSVSIEDYMSRWCNVIQTPNSPTPQKNHRMPQLFSLVERDNLDKYNKFINELSVRIEGGRSPTDILPYDEDLLRLRLSLRVNSNTEFYPDSVQVIKRNQFALQLDSDKKTESDKDSTSTVTTKGELQSLNQREKQQLSEDEELPFQQGLPLKEDNINLKNLRPQSRNFHGLSFRCYKPKS